MIEDYPNAAKRHLEDSKTLLDSKRWDNSAYLAGYVVECSLKAVVTTPTPPPEIDVKIIGHNLTKLMSILETMAASRSGGRRRSVDGRLIGRLRSELSTHVIWNPSMRYMRSGMVTESDAHKWWRLANGVFGGLAKTYCTGDSA